MAFRRHMLIVLSALTLLVSLASSPAGAQETAPASRDKNVFPEAPELELTSVETQVQVPDVRLEMAYSVLAGGADAVDQLKALTDAAPGRQVGQPGNNRIDQLVQRRFTKAVAEMNKPQADRAAAAQQAIADAARAEAAFMQARHEAKVVPVPPGAASRSELVSFFYSLVDAYWTFAWLFVIVAAIILVSWRFQRNRRSLVVVGSIFGAVGVLMLAIGWLKSDSSSKPGVVGAGPATTVAELNARVDAAAAASFEADKKMADALAGLWQTGRVTYPTAAFIPGKATLALEGGASVRLYALAPNLMEPANLPEGGFTGKLVYIGSGTSADLTGKSIENSAVLMEFDSAKRWIDAAQLGAKVIVLLEPPEGMNETFTEAAQKRSESPLSVPRFYLKRADLLSKFGKDWAESLKGGAAVKIDQEPSRWERREIAADWLFIPAAAPASAADGKAGANNELIHIQAYKDGRSIVPELSPGAQSAGNLVVAMRLLDGFTKQPPRRPVLLTIVNDHTNALLGEQEFNFAAFMPADAAVRELTELENSLATTKFLRELYSRQPSAEFIAELRLAVRDVAGKKLELKKLVDDKLKLMRNTVRDERRRIGERLDTEDRRLKKNLPPRISEAERLALNDRVKAIDAESTDVVRMMKLFIKFRSTTFEELPPALRERLGKVFAEIAAEQDRIAAEIEVSRARLASNLMLRRRLAVLTRPEKETPLATGAEVLARQCAPLPATLVLGLDLAFGTDRVGFFHFGAMKSDSAADEAYQKFMTFVARYSLQVAADFERSTGETNRLDDTIRGAAGLPWAAHLGGKYAMQSDTYYQYQVPGLTLTSTRDSRPFAYTPSDRFSNLKAENFREVSRFVEAYLPKLIDSPDLGAMAAAKKKAELTPLTIEASARRHDQFAVQLPDAPLPGAVMITSILPALMPNNAAMLAEVEPRSASMTDARGVTVLRGSVWRNSSPLIATYDPSYRRMTMALDMGDWQKRNSGSDFTAAVTAFYVPKVLVAAEFEKVDIIGLTQPLNLSPVGAVMVYDASQDSLPRHFAVMGLSPEGAVPSKAVPLASDGTGCILLEPGMSFKLRFGTGLAINSTPETVRGEGFPSNSGTLRNLVLSTAQDMHSLTKQRLDMLSSKGVKNETGEMYNKDAKEEIDRAVSMGAAGDNAALMVHAEVARGLAFRAYTRGRATIDDLTKAVVIFLALVIPFCVFVTKLTSPFTDVNRNLAMFAGVFVVMALLLRAVHPAFAVAETPEVVILAFIILGLAGFVATVLITKFNSSMNQVVEESQMAESSDAPQGRLAGVAFVVGVNNMKRRRIRTTLTTATIILVTFTMLSVISVGQDVAPTTVRMGPTTPYSGFLFVRSGLVPIDAVQMRRMRAHFEGGSSGAATVVARAWAQRLGQFGDYLGYQLIPKNPEPGASLRSITAKVLVGVEVAEDGFVGKMPLTAGRWLSSDAAPEALLSVESAKLLGITPLNLQGQVLRISGRDLQLVGLLDDDELAKMRDLADIPLLPMLSQATQTAQDKNNADRAAQEAAGSASLDAGGSVAGPGVTQARPVDVAFVSIGFARSLGEADYRSLSVKYDDAKGADGQPLGAAGAARKAWDTSNDLIQFQHALVSVGLKEAVQLPEANRKIEAGQYTLASSSTTQVGNILKVAIPIILAATIILNTMLGSVLERRREVAIYNAIGLNPGHVMVFFLAESLVFGMVGSVAGYLIGQILSLAITSMENAHWIAPLGLSLNYSSLSVVVVIFLTIGTVLLSTVYPAMMAARAAVPSGQRRWSLPQPVGNQIHVQFPFSYDANRVLGVCAYLREYMRQNSEASTGQFLAKLGPVGRVPGAKPQAAEEGDGKAYAMLFDIAPAPFDLGVNQKMEVYAYYDPRVKAHMLSVHLTRLSGERGNWVAVNQPFLETLRKRLLGWRSQKTSTQQAFFHEGEKLFADAVDLPVAGKSDK